MTIRVVIADDHRVVRDGLRYLLSQEPDIEVAGEAGDGEQALRVLRATRPDVLLLDLSMPGLDGHGVLAALGELPGRPAVVVLTSATDEEHLVRAIAAGATSYLLKSATDEDLIPAIRAVAAGKPFFSPAVTAVLVDDYVRMAKDPGPSVFESLSPREREVLQLIAEGHSTKEVARILKVSVKTVETHRRQLMNKLELFSVAELTRYAIREGLVSLETRAGSV